MSTLVASLIGRLTLDDQFSGGLKTAENNASSFSSNVKRSIGIAATGMAAFGAATSAASGVAINAAIKFEDAFANVRKTVDATDEQLAELQKQIREMAVASDNPLSSLDNAALTLTDIAAQAGQLGVPIEMIGEFSQVIGELTVAAESLGADAASDLARFANNAKVPFEQFRDVGDTIVNLGNNLPTTEREILGFATKMASGLSLIGIGHKDILGFSAALSSVGVTAELGSTNFNKFALDIASAVSKGGEDLDAFAKIAGKSAIDFKNLFEKDAKGALVLFLEELGKLDQGDQLAALESIGANSSEMVRTLLSLANAGDILTDSLTFANDATGALAVEAAAKAATTQGAINRLKNTLNELALTVGEILLPPFAKAVSAFTDIINKVRSINPELFATIVKVTALAGSFGLVIGIGIKLMPLLAMFGTFLTGPIGIGLAIAAGAAYAFSKNLFGVQDATSRVLDKIKNMLKPLRTFIDYFAAFGKERGIQTMLTHLFLAVKDSQTSIEWLFRQFGLGEGISKRLADTINTLGINFLRVFEAFKNDGIKGAISEAFAILKESALSAIDGLVQLGMDFVSMGLDWMNNLITGVDQSDVAPNLINRIADAIVSGIQWIFSDGIPLLTNAVQSFIPVFTGWVDKAKTDILPKLMDFATNVFQFLVNDVAVPIAAAAIRIGITLVSSLADWMQTSGIPLLTEFFKTTWEWFKDVAPIVFEKAVTFGVQIVNSLTAWILNTGIPLLTEFFKTIWEWFKSDVAPVVFEKAKELAIQIVEGIKTWWNEEGKDLLSTFLQNAWTFLKDDVAPKALEAAKDIGTQIIDSIVSQ